MKESGRTRKMKRKATEKERQERGRALKVMEAKCGANDARIWKDANSSSVFLLLEIEFENCSSRLAARAKGM